MKKLFCLLLVLLLPTVAFAKDYITYEQIRSHDTGERVTVRAKVDTYDASGGRVTAEVLIKGNNGWVKQWIFDFNDAQLDDYWAAFLNGEECYIKGKVAGGYLIGVIVSGIYEEPSLIHEVGISFLMMLIPVLIFVFGVAIYASQKEQYFKSIVKTKLLHINSINTPYASTGRAIARGMIGEAIAGETGGIIGAMTTPQHVYTSYEYTFMVYFKNGAFKIDTAKPKTDKFDKYIEKLVDY